MTRTEITDIAIKEKTLIKKFCSLTGVICLYIIASVIQAFWGLFCNYLFHNDKEVFQKITPVAIVIGWGSCTVHQMILGMFVFCAILPMMSFPWSKEKYLGHPDDINKSRISTLICAIIPLLISYPCMCVVEAHLMYVEDQPDIWSSEGAIFALSGYMKTLPVWIMLAIDEIIQRKEKNQIKIYVDESLPSPQSQKMNSGYLNIVPVRNSSKVTTTQPDTIETDTTQTDTTQPDTIETRV